MKLMKSKLAIALVLTVMSIGLFSFTTTPVRAQETSSEVIQEKDYESAALPAVLVAAFVRGVVAGAAVGLAYKAYTYLTSSKAGSSEYPTDVLD